MSSLMNVKSDWSSHALAALREAGHRTGGARTAVVGALAQQSCCLSARELAQEMGKRGETVGLASIYRALELLDELGLVQRLDAGEGTARFEPLLPHGEHHHHMVCDRCGRVSQFEDPKLEREIERVSAAVPFITKSHDIVLHGVCTKCHA